MVEGVVVKTFRFAISSADEFLVRSCYNTSLAVGSLVPPLRQYRLPAAPLLCQVRDDGSCDHVTVSRKDLERLQHVVRTTKSLLTDVLSRDVLTAVASVPALDQGARRLMTRLETY